ncbi:hypothetical protein BFP97_13610 [Roseivirga sp. 4D4]|uniref:glycosyltransferase family 4 protein n=1 Tax=Roseivirga sp. 4D4 TaxID=1889784 RepID=UPI00085327C2|nr:glycosyltransferase family 4 protein [Roseivirga sp. 4D4]OEK02494.1 hypothetical protein BFP97_13610 [Roseivirga sp. 4D4]
MRVLMISSEWPSDEHPNSGLFVKRQFDYLKKNGVNIEIYSFRGGGSLKNYWIHRRKIKSTIKTFKPDIFHAQFAQSALLVVGRKGKLVVTYRGDDAQGIVNEKGVQTKKGLILMLIGKIVSTVSDKIIVVSKHLLKKIPWISDASVIPSGLELYRYDKLLKSDRASMREKLGIPPGFMILFPNSTSNPNKNYQLVEQALASVAINERKDFFVKTIFGQSHEELLQYMRASDCMILTSLREGSPNVIKEAMALNTPIISVPVGDVPERISKLKGSFVSQGYDPQELANLMIKAKEFDYSEYNSRELVSLLDEQKLTEGLIDIYHSLMN